MKLLQNEHRDIKKLLESYGYGKGDFLFSKKAGWVRIFLRGEDIHFAYRHKKISKIIDGQFILTVHYFIRDQHRETAVPDWESVLNQLSKRLRQLAKEDSS